MDPLNKPEDQASIAVVRAAAFLLMNTALGLLESDPHSFSERPCSTCRAVSEIAGRPFGCVKKALRSKGEPK